MDMFIYKYYLFHKYLLSAYYGQMLEYHTNTEKSHIPALIKCLEMKHIVPPKNDKFLLTRF